VEIEGYSIEEYENFISYTIQNFVADLGGLIGLFLGFSILSFVEIFYNCVTFCCRKKKIKEQVHPEILVVKKKY
jgi:hypothetical protein